MDRVMFHSIWTVLLLVLFVGIWVWAWSGKRKQSFDEAARLPLDDEAPIKAKKAARAAGNSKRSSQRKRVVRKNG